MISSLGVYLEKYLYLIGAFAIFMIVVFSYIVYTVKRKNKKNIVLRGLLMDLTENEVLALALICVNFIFLSFIFIFKYNLDLAIGIISEVLVLFGFLLTKNIKNLLINGGINIVNIGVIYLGNIVQHLDIASNTLHFVLKVSMNVFGLLFYIFIFGKYIRNICIKEVK